MNITKTLHLVCVIMIAICSAEITICGAGETITIGGTGSGLGVMKILGAAFEKKHPGIKVQVLPSIGSEGGIKGVAKGALDIGISARPFKGGETSLGLSSVEYAKTPLAIVARRDTNASGLTTEDLVKIYDGRMLTWTDGRRIRPVLRPESETNTQILKEWSPEINRALETAMSRKGMITAITDQDAVDIIEKTPGAFGFSSLAQVITEKVPLKILLLNGISPTPGNLSNGSYRLKRSLFIVTGPKASATARDFLDFVLSSAGTKILNESGYIVTPQKNGQ